jgi:hypothetical protein
VEAIAKQHWTPNAPLALLLERLENVKPYGQGYRACCPAHDSKSKNTLSIRTAEDGRVLLHCFAGCSPLEIVRALGLELSDLFEKPPANMTAQEKVKIRQLAKQGQWKTALEFLPLEIAVVECAAVQLITGKPLNLADHHRLELASKRISSARRVLCDR